MASKSKSRRRVLRASCLLAALIVAGSSFAWFTSKDEVTNRLSAAANYGVSIAENFQPPENWIPGQTINKDVGVVNTGNVDAFTRVWLTGEMKVLNTTALGDTSKTVYANFGNVASATETTDDNLKALNLNKYKDVGNERYYYKELDVAQTDNPQNDGENNQKNGYQYDGVRGTDNPGNGAAPSTPNSTAYSEVQTIQAGGYLVFAPSNAEYEYVTNQETKLKVLVKYDNSGTASQGEETVTVPAGTLVKVTTKGNVYSADRNATGEITNLCNGTYTDKSVRGSTPVNVVYVKAQDTTTDKFKPVIVDAETFAPVTTGTYIFARNEDLQSESGAVKVAYATLDDYEFAGYYFDATNDNAKVWAGKGTYWALKNADARGTNRSNYTLPKNYDITINKVATNPATKTDTGYGNEYTDTVLSLDFDNSGYLASVTPATNLEMYHANYKVIENSALDWSYDATNKVLSAIYQGAGKLDATNDNTATLRTAKLRDDIVVDIQLANIGTDSEEWTVISDTAKDTKIKYYAKPDDGKEYVVSDDPIDVDINRLWTFYYNNDVEEGDTTTKLVDSVTLRHTTQKEAFIAFDFDLNVNMESAQVTMDEAGKEQATAVTSWVATKDSSNNNVNTTAKPGTMVYTPANGTEISDVDWTYSST